MMSDSALSSRKPCRHTLLWIGRVCSWNAEPKLTMHNTLPQTCPYVFTVKQLYQQCNTLNSELYYYLIYTVIILSQRNAAVLT